MDSGNSGSIQSTSTGGCGDDQEFESSHGRETVSTLFNSTSMALNKDFSNFDPTSFSQSFPCNNFMINHIDHIHSDIVWPNKYICTGLDKQQMITCVTEPYQEGLPPPPLPIQTSMVPTMSGSPRLVDRGRGRGDGRNPKKRSRVSRRAPTTVLTTDTNNFRQMVQEFTGIPSCPFSSRARFDYSVGFGKRLPKNNGEVCNSGIQTSPYLMRPFPNNATDLSRNGFALGHIMCTSTNTNANTNVVIDTTTTTTSIGITENVTTVEDDVGRNYNGTRANAITVDNGAPLINHGGITKGEAILDSWICSSD